MRQKKQEIQIKHIAIIVLFLLFFQYVSVIIPFIEARAEGDLENEEENTTEIGKLEVFDKKNSEEENILNRINGYITIPAPNEESYNSERFFYSFDGYNWTYAEGDKTVRNTVAEKVYVVGRSYNPNTYEDIRDYSFYKEYEIVDGFNSSNIPVFPGEGGDIVIFGATRNTRNADEELTEVSNEKNEEDTIVGIYNKDGVYYKYGILNWDSIAGEFSIEDGYKPSLLSYDKIKIQKMKNNNIGNILSKRC